MNYFIWDASPEIFRIGWFALRYYSLLFAGAILLHYFLTATIVRRERYRVDLDQLLMYGFWGVVIGARLGHVIFYSPDYYFSDPIRILKVWEGGLASHGAFFGFTLAVYIYCQRNILPFRLLFDICLGLQGVVFLVRLGNFFNSEIIGKPTDVPWAVVFANVDQIPRHPAQLYEAAGYLIVLLLVLALYFLGGIKFGNLKLLGVTLLGNSIVRFSAEFFKESQVAFEDGMALNMGQILSLPFFFFAIGLFFYKAKPLPRESFIIESSSSSQSTKGKEENSSRQSKKKGKKK